MVPEINWWAVALATISTMVVGSIWYTPKVFGAWWMKAAKVETPANAAYAIVVTVIVSFISAWVLARASAIAQHLHGGSFLANTLVTAIILWGGFTAARFITHDAFENRPRLAQHRPRAGDLRGDGAHHRPDGNLAAGIHPAQGACEAAGRFERLAPEAGQAIRG